MAGPERGAGHLDGDVHDAVQGVQVTGHHDVTTDADELGQRRPRRARLHRAGELEVVRPRDRPARHGAEPTTGTDHPDPHPVLPRDDDREGS